MAYELLKDSTIQPEAVAGSIVYDLRGHDYGLAREDTASTGIEHICVTFEEDGGYPFFTVPLRDLKRL